MNSLVAGLIICEEKNVSLKEMVDKSHLGQHTRTIAHLVYVNKDIVTLGYGEKAED